MKHDDLIAFLIEEAQHRMINDEHTKKMQKQHLQLMQKGLQEDKLAKGRDLINRRTQIMMSLVEIAKKKQDMWKLTFMQRVEEKKVKHHGRKRRPKRQRQWQWQQSIMTMMSCSHSHAPLITQMLLQPSNYQNPNWAHV